MSDDENKNCENEEKGELLGEKAADFETALAATGFGKFNIFLIMLAIPASWAAQFETMAMAYVFPAAQCDLDLKLDDKGILNAITFGGTIIGSFIWGFLFDTIGRRKLLIVLYFCDIVCILTSGFATTKEFLLFTKFVGGFIISGPFAGMSTYLSEMQVSRYRYRMPLFIGMGFSLGFIYMPLSAAIILPLNIQFKITDYLVMNSWGLFLIHTALPAFCCGLAFLVLPESPKFLMSMGRNQEALKIFSKMYAVNFNKSPESYPIKELIKEVESQNEKYSCFLEYIKHGYSRIVPLFRYPHVKNFIMVCMLNAFTSSGTTVLLLWMPQVFQALNDYKFLNNGTIGTLCEMLDVIRPSSQNVEKKCFVNTNNMVYLSAAAVAFISLIGFLIASSGINKVGHKRLLSFATTLAVCGVIGIFFSKNERMLTFFFSVFKMSGSLSICVVTVIKVNLFPTSLRATVISFASICSTGAVMFGNVLFPQLLKIGCEPPFIAIAFLMLFAFLVSLLLPKQKKVLE